MKIVITESQLKQMISERVGQIITEMVDQGQIDEGLWDDMKAKTAGLRAGVSKVGGDITQGAKNLGTSVVQGAKDLGTNAVQGAKNLGTSVVQGAKNATQGVRDYSQSVSDTAKKALLQAEVDNVYNDFVKTWRVANTLKGKYRTFRKNGMFATADPNNPNNM